MTDAKFVVHSVALRGQDAITNLLGSNGYVVREFGSVAAFLSSGAAANSGCVLAPLDEQNDDGSVLQERLRTALHTLPVITIGHAPPTDSVVRTIRNGAACVLTEPNSGELIAAIKAAFRLDRYRREWVHEYDSARDRLECLSSRQCEVLKHLAVGKLNKVIARDLYLSPRTIEKHRREIHNRLGTSSLAEVAVLVERMKWPGSIVYSIPLEAFEASVSEERLLNSVGA